VNKRRLVVQIVLLAAVASAAFVGWSTMHSKASAANASTTVVTVGTGNVQSTVSGTGNVQASNSISLSSDSAVSSNKVTQIFVKLADTVTAGEPLAKVDDTTLQAALTAANAQLASAQASLASTQAGATADVKA